MIRRSSEYRREERSRMREGNGVVTIQHYWEKVSEMRSATRMFAKLILPPGASIGPHDHQQEEEIFVILKGTATVTDNGETKVLQPGDTMLTGGGASHSLANLGSETLEVLAVIGTYPAAGE